MLTLLESNEKAGRLSCGGLFVTVRECVDAMRGALGPGGDNGLIGDAELKLFNCDR